MAILKATLKQHLANNDTIFTSTASEVCLEMFEMYILTLVLLLLVTKQTLLINNFSDNQDVWHIIR